MQQYAGVYLLKNYSTCFGCLSHPSSGEHQTVTAASGLDTFLCPLSRNSGSLDLLESYENFQVNQGTALDVTCKGRLNLSWTGT